MFGIDPGLPHEFARRVENARDDNLLIGAGLSRTIFSCDHGFSPSFAVPADNRPTDPSSPPKTVGNVRASPPLPSTAWPSTGRGATAHPDCEQSAHTAPGL